MKFLTYSFWSSLKRSSEVASIYSVRIFAALLSRLSKLVFIGTLPATLPLKKLFGPPTAEWYAAWPEAWPEGVGYVGAGLGMPEPGVNGFLRPTRLRVSLIRLPLILRSRGLSKASEGLRLTSRSQGLYITDKVYEVDRNRK